jgi:Zn-dependent peptidase ImmA (M78 family)/transcriptional regulator with XRE-family HTH domain
VSTKTTIGARIRALRERAGIQSQELAARVGLDPSAMSNVERDKRAVKTEELALIAKALGVSPLAILSEGSLLERLPVAARAQAEVVSDGSAVARLTALAELHEVLSAHDIPSNPCLGDVPAVDIDRWLSSADMLSSWVRTQIPLEGPHTDRFYELATAIEKEFRVDVLIEDSGDEIAGASITDRRFPFILVNRDQPVTRALFTLAHELAHVLSGEGESALTLDVNLTAHTNPERFANAFAASLLMPKARIEGIITESGRGATALGRMVSEFGVSFESLVYRLHNVRIINAHGRDQLRGRGWTAVLTDLEDNDMRRALLSSLGMRPEQKPPDLLTERAFQGYQQGVVSVRPLAGLLGLPPDDLLERMVRVQDSRDALGDDYSRFVEVSDEDRYSGDPV